MAKKQEYLGMEVKKKGNGFFIECGLAIDARSRIQAQKRLEDCKMKPIVVLTEREAHGLLGRLMTMLRPRAFGKKEERGLLESWQQLKKGVRKKGKAA